MKGTQYKDPQNIAATNIHANETKQVKKRIIFCVDNNPFSLLGFSFDRLYIRKESFWFTSISCIIFSHLFIQCLLPITVPNQHKPAINPTKQIISGKNVNS